MSEAPPVVAPPAPAASAAGRRSGWFALIVIGSILTFISATTLAAAATIAGAVFSRTDDGYLTTPSARLSAQTFAVVSPPARLEGARGADSLPDIRISLSAGTPGGEPVFIGIGPTADVKEYLADVHVAEITGMRGVPFELRTRDIAGTEQPESPDSQDFWVASDAGGGVRELTWLIEPGTWTVVIMNADGTQGISTNVAAGVEAPWAAPLAATFAAVAAGMLLIGVAVILVGVFGWGRGRASTAPIVGAYPVAVTGVLRGTPSQWLWLVKWILAIPHWIVLAILWVAFVVATIAAGFAILFTGRYPRPIFEFTVGVLRWNWRVSFYSYSALGTDQYPPFTLEHTDYPADFDVVYPERLSHGLVLVKSWLLAIPHLLVVSILTGGAMWGVGSWPGNWPGGGWPPGGVSASLLSLLVLVAAVILLFTGRYQQPLFDLIMGVNRWALRVASYVALMRDEYPPFRLDQGAAELPTANTVLSNDGTAH